ncbi:MAG: pyruvate kinase [bacterium]|nr:pyruvate kinase [bacterium]
MKALTEKRTKILATLGPSCASEMVLSSLFARGVDIIRINASHYKDPNMIGAHIKLVRKVAKKTKYPIGILVDLQGPKIRVGQFADDAIELVKGASFTLYRDHDRLGQLEGVGISYPGLIDDLALGDPVYIDDGRVRLKVISKDKISVTCEVEVGGKVSNNKGINIPNTILSQSVLTEKDKRDLAVAVEHQVEYVALSFVSEGKDIVEMREYMHSIGGEGLDIIAKIERRSAVDDIVNILKETDVVMVARGDLGVEIGIENVPQVQKQIIREGLKYIRPVIVATQMLETMVHSLMATRAEVSDVANAIYDRCDAVMLSGETAVGIDPNNVVETMSNICRATDFHRIELKRTRYSQVIKLFEQKTKATSICKAADQIAEENQADVMLAFTSSGSSARILSKLNSSMPIIAPTDDQRVLRKMNLFRGVIPVEMKKSFSEIKSWEEMIHITVEDLLDKGLLKRGDTVVITAGIPIGITGGTNSIRLIDIE